MWVVLILIIVIVVVLSMKSKKHVVSLVLYSSEDCPLCRELKDDAWPKLIEDFPDIEFKNIDCLENKEAARKAGITAFPTVILTRLVLGEKVESKYRGAWSYDGLSAELN